MTDIIKNAIDGQRKALNCLYASNKEKAFFIANSLLDNEKDVSDSVANAFITAFSSFANEHIEDEKDFEALVLASLGSEIRALSDKNDVSFKIPGDRNFMITSKIDVSENDNETADLIFTELTPLQKLVFLLMSVGSLGKKDIASAIGTDIKTADVVIDSVKGNIKRISKEAFDFDKMASAFSNRKPNASFPDDCDTKVYDYITKISAENELSRKSFMKRLTALAVAVCLVIIATIGVCIFKYSGNFNSEGVYRAKIVIKDYGTITIDMDAKNAPITVENFFNLVRSDFYDGLTIHRVNSEYLIHGGSPDGTNWGASEHNIYGEFAENGFENGLSHTRGVISMARSDHYDSASCQFFILKSDITELDGKFAAFGKVVRGMDVVDKICEEVTTFDSNGAIVAHKQPIIKRITISRIK